MQLGEEVKDVKKKNKKGLTTFNIANPLII